MKRQMGEDERGLLVLKPRRTAAPDSAKTLPQNSCTVGLITISFTSTSAGCSIA